MAPGPELDPPEQIDLGLSEALDLLAALEDARDVLIGTNTSPFSPRSNIRFRSSAVSLDLNKEDPMSIELLRASEAARRLGILTKDLLGLVHERKIRYVMVDGIAHIPVDAVDEFRARAS